MQYELLEDGYDDEFSVAPSKPKVSTYKMVVASFLVSAGVASVAWTSGNTPFTTSLATSDRISNVQPSADTEPTSDCPDCSSHVPPAVLGSPAKMDTHMRSTPSLFKLSSKKVSCDACDSLGDSACLDLLQSALNSLDDTEKLPLEKNMLAHKYSCGASLSDDSCLSYLDGKISTLTNDDQLTLLTEACYDGTLAVDAPEVTEEPESDEEPAQADPSAQKQPAPSDSDPQTLPAPNDSAPQMQPAPTDSTQQMQPAPNTDAGVAPTDAAPPAKAHKSRAH
eukprot:CAMPEP_0185792814 /NCGR_PEP_ID=MMETSP1174-20130828/159136_1 /TAXON_ID=35687 /ORGANISM="Dictyocha speculum, Strain CCMP1381" /LENGTH=279 /DNA_ID=CAMNT_0028487907 /DNA_START=44 /DNA_END=883 /DNA_ORIENTATION=+